MSGRHSSTALPWQVLLFGEPRAEFQNQASGRIEYRRSTLLLARLASAPERTWSRDEIGELLWPGEYPEVARDRLRQTLAVLNKALRETGAESPIIATKTHLSLDRAVCTVDTEEFEREVKQALALTSDEERVAALQKALTKVSGQVLAGFTEDWVQAFRDHISGVVHDARIALAKSLAQFSRDQEALSVLHDSIRERPLNDQANLLRATILRNMGQASEAALAAKEYRERLHAELKLEPGPQWHEFFQPAPAAKSQSATTRRVWHHVAQPLTRFFGRSAEIEWLTQTLLDSEYRLVTITGPGGSGKTRLSVEFANRYAPSEVTVVGIGLAELDDAEQALYAIAETMGLQADSVADVIALVKQAFQGHTFWFVFDNCEHLMPGIASVVQRLLSELENSKAICTSRVLLGLLGERELALPTLALPKNASSPEDLMAFPAVDMLVERIQARRPDYRLTADEGPVVAELIDKLEGIPLAIEIAASRGSVMTTREMLTALESRLDFLSSKYSNLPERHHAMRNALEWSFNDLDPDLRNLAFMMSVFAGSWTIQAAASVMEDSDVAEGVQELRARSLIQAEQSGEEMRFRMLEVVRQFAQEQMTEEEKEVAQAKHVRYFSDYSQELFSILSNGERVTAVRAFRKILPDHRLACATALREPTKYQELLSPLVVWMLEFYESIGLVREASQKILAVIETGLLNEKQLIEATTFYGHTLAMIKDFEGVHRIVPTLMPELEKLHDTRFRFLLSINLSHMVWVANVEGCSERLVPHLVRLIDEMDNPRQKALVNLNLSNTLAHLELFDEAIQRCHAAISLVENTSPGRVLGYAYLNAARLYLATGKPAEALKLCQSAYGVFLDTEEALGVGSAIRGFVAAYLALDSQLELANEIGQLVGFELAHTRRCGGHILPTEGTGYQDGIGSLKRVLGDNFNSVMEQGEAMNTQEVANLIELLARHKLQKS